MTDTHTEQLPRFATRSDREALSRPAGEGGLIQNISNDERWISTLGGAVLLLGGLARGKLSGLVLSAVGGSLLYRGYTGHCHGYEALGIDTSEHGPATAVAAQQGVKVEQAIAVNRSPEELYAFWREVENLPRVMRHLESVEAIDSQRSRWVARSWRDTTVEWEAEIINQREPELIAWRSLPGGDIDTAGSVHFQALPHGRGTKISVSLKYNPPGGKAGAAVAWLLGSGLEQELDQDLREFKSQMEAGEAPTIQGQPSGS